MDFEKPYLNSYRLLVGKVTYEELASEGEFYLPPNHEDPQVTIDYYESIEDYEKCAEIVNFYSTDRINKSYKPDILYF